MLLLLVGSAGNLTEGADGSPDYGMPAASEFWRRTNRGWEWGLEIQHARRVNRLPPITGVHPGVIAGLQVLCCLAAFCLWPTGRGKSAAGR